MNQITTSAELKAAILELEKKKEIQKLTIKGQAYHAKQALNPVHFIKNTFSHVAETPEIKKTLNSKGAAMFKKMLNDKKIIHEHLQNGGKIADLKNKFSFAKPIPS